MSKVTDSPIGKTYSDRTAWCLSRPGKKLSMELINNLELPLGIRAIPLTKGLYTLVDESDYDYLMQWNWYARSGDGFIYASRTDYKTKNIINIHSVLCPSADNKEPDHIDGSGLNNRRNNLRPATHQQNMWNRKSVTGSSSKYKGVDWYAASGSWRAYIKIDGKQKHLGCYRNEDDAARAYNEAAKELHNQFAKLNPVEGKASPRIVHPNKGKQRKKDKSND